MLSHVALALACAWTVVGTPVDTSTLYERVAAPEEVQSFFDQEDLPKFGSTQELVERCQVKCDTAGDDCGGFVVDHSEKDSSRGHCYLYRRNILAGPERSLFKRPVTKRGSDDKRQAYVKQLRYYEGCDGCIPNEPEGVTMFCSSFLKIPTVTKTVFTSPCGSTVTATGTAQASGQSTETIPETGIVTETSTTTALVTTGTDVTQVTATTVTTSFATVTTTTVVSTTGANFNPPVVWPRWFPYYSSESSSSSSSSSSMQMPSGGYGVPCVTNAAQAARISSVCSCLDISTSTSTEFVTLGCTEAASTEVTVTATSFQVVTLTTTDATATSVEQTTAYTDVAASITTTTDQTSVEQTTTTDISAAVATTTCPAMMPTYCPQTGTCVDTKNDPKNCGTCGMTCDATQNCMGGNCQRRRYFGDESKICPMEGSPCQMGRAAGCSCFRTTESTGMGASFNNGACITNPPGTCSGMGCNNSQDCPGDNVCVIRCKPRGSEFQGGCTTPMDQCANPMMRKRLFRS